MRNVVRQANLFSTSDELPAGFRYLRDIISAEEESALVVELERLPFKEFEFHGFTGKRRVVSYGWRYDFNGGGFTRIEPAPACLKPLRTRAAAFASLQEDKLEQVLVTEYKPGAAIGWHKDRDVFDEVVGISLLSACNFRFRRKAGIRWDRLSVTAEPRSIYLLRGPSRTEWEHSIPGVDALRYSITFRSLKHSRMR